MRRYHLGHITSGGSPIDIEKWKTLARSGRVVEDGASCAAGFDGSFSVDSTAWVKCTADGFLFGARVWSRPDGAPKDWRVPREEVAAEVADTMTRYQVGRVFCDPFLWRDEIDEWVGEYNTGGNEVVLVLSTNVAKRFSAACDRFCVAIEEGRVSHDGDERLTQALAACTKKQVRVADDPDNGRTRFVIAKADTRRIDVAVAAILAP